MPPSRANIPNGTYVPRVNSCAAPRLIVRLSRQPEFRADCRWIAGQAGVSVGEVNICTQLIKALAARAPNLKVVVSTTTTTGMAELQKKLPIHISKIYYPVDARRFVRRALRMISPEAIVLVEAEIWPNFLWRAADLGTPVFLVNARLSERSHRGYKRVGFLFRGIFRSFAGIGCQNAADAKRLEEIGCRPERIHVVGNLKFDAATVSDKTLLDVPALFAQLGVSPGAPVLVAGSTHAGEEKLLGEIFLRLRTKFPALFFVIVPRHHERGKEAGRTSRLYGAEGGACPSGPELRRGRDGQGLHNFN